MTLVTKNGNYFYLLIDRDDNGQANVHFLNIVDELDLLSLMDEEEAQAYIDEHATKEEIPVIEEPIQEIIEEPELEVPKEKSNLGPIVILALVSIAGVGGFLAYKVKGKKKKELDKQIDPDADYLEEEDEYIVDIPEEEEES